MQPVAPPSPRARRMLEAPDLSEDDIRLLAQIASGVSAKDAADNLRLSARTVHRRLRQICERLEVGTPIEAVVWAVRRQLI
ncbi:LuxR family transcriptional regulator [Actinomadura sp. NBRC 104425]|nr:LuxR family transcriptional regulator [Actinomadura sp. NBRC 104425]